MTDTTSLRELDGKLRALAENPLLLGAERDMLNYCIREISAALAARAEPQAGESADPFPWLREKVAEWEASEDILPAKHFAHELCSILDAMTGDDLRALIHARQQDNIAIVRADEGTSAPSPASRARPEAQGEADQYECRVILRDGFGEWHKCSREQYDHIRLTGFYNGPGGAQCEARALYATPPADRAPGEVGEDDAKLVDALADHAYSDAADGRSCPSDATEQAREALIRRLAALEAQASAPGMPGIDDDTAAYVDPNTRSIHIDWDADPANQLSLIVKRDGSVAFAAYHHGQKTVGNAMGPEFKQAMRLWASAPGGEVAQFIQDCADGLPEWQPGECRKRAIALLAARTGKPGQQEGTP